MPRRAGYYNLSTHFPWIGMRTAQLDGAHVEFHRGIRNPIGIKIGPAMTTRLAASALLDALDPEREPGRITLIHRMGARQGRGEAAAARRGGARDRPHGAVGLRSDARQHRDHAAAASRRAGSTRSSTSSSSSFELHAQLGSQLGGVHFELTGEDVTECIGGARGLDEADLERAYKSRVDPRLNYEQALEMAMRIARHLRGGA